MKRHVLSLPAGFVALSLFAQVPNGSFESWIPSGLGYDDPEGWISWNSVSWPLGGVLSCEEGSPGAVGASYARITTRNVTGVGILPGLLFTGGTTGAGFPYNQRPAALNGQYQYNIPSGDGGMIGVSLSKWNVGTQTQDPIGAGVLVIPVGVQSSWADFSIPIIYSDPAYPDSAVITILSSTGSGVAGSTVSVDDLSFGPAGSSIAENAGAIFTLGPSPAVDVLNISSVGEMTEVTLTDVSGRVLHTEQVVGNASLQIGLESLTNGMYIARVRFANGAVGSQVFLKG